MIGLVISDAQSAFVPFRTISIILGHEYLHTISQCKIGLNGMAALKLDLSKTFDRVEWIYLDYIMRKMGFDSRWISVIMRCISTISFSILLNGSPGIFFSSSRGIR